MKYQHAKQRENLQCLISFYKNNKKINIFSIPKVVIGLNTTKLYFI